MTKDELVAIIQKELKDNPKASGSEIAKKHEIPLHIVEMYKKRILKGQK